MSAERDQIAAERDDAPPGFAARTASRVDRDGAPLWQLVRFADGVSDADAAGIEAALHAANLLDAWVDQDDTGAGLDSETVLAPLPDALRPNGSTLAEVLVAEPSTGVPPARIDAVLRSVGYGGDSSPAAAPSITAVGRFVQGVQLGGHSKPHAEYIGATARARRRAVRIADLDVRIAASEHTIDRYDEQIASAQSLLSAVAAARTDLPGTTAISKELHAETLAAGVLRATNDALAPARLELDQSIAEVGARQRDLHKRATEHAMPITTPEIEAIAEAVVRFRAAGTTLASARSTEISWTDQVEAAEREVDDAQATYDEYVVTADQAVSNHRGHQQELEALRAAIGASADQVDADIAETQTAIVTAKAELNEARRQENIAVETDGRAEGECSGAGKAVHAAIVETQTDAHRLAPYAGCELRDLLRVAADERQLWPGVASDWPDAALLARSRRSTYWPKIRALPSRRCRLRCRSSTPPS